MEQLEQTANKTTTSKYVRDFESLFVTIKLEQLRDKARDGNLRHCQFRSLCWRYFLHCLPEQYDHWLESCIKSRKEYEAIQAKYSVAKQLADAYSDNNTQQSILTTNNKSTNSSKQSNEEVGTYEEQYPHQKAIDADDQDKYNDEEKGDDEGSEMSAAVIVTRNKELEEEQQYIKASSQCDHKNVFRTIERDVVRTFPDMEFFRQTEMQAILENVLFHFASENPHLSYKQGMHELLATLLYVLHTDSQNCLINHEGGYANETIATLLDLKYLEHDVFHLFCALMNSIETWYQNDEILVVPEPVINRKENGISNRSNRQQVSSVLGIKLKMISENIVRNYDLELFNHLEALQIAPQIYGIRWMRLLFGREFEFLDLLTVWDAIICDKVSMSLTDYIFASMLVTIREELVNGDYTDCLNNLMRHQFKDVQYVIKLALHLRDPHKHARPRSIHTGIGKHYNETVKHGRYSPETSLTSKLSQQYITSKQKVQQSNNRNLHLFTPTNHGNVDTATRRTYSPKMNSSSNIDNRDSRKIFSTTSKGDKQRQDYSTGATTNSAASGIRFMNPSSRFSGSVGSSTNKFLPNINKFVSSIGQNIQDKTNVSQAASISRVQSSQQWLAPSSSQGGAPSSGRSQQQQQQYHHRSNDLSLLKVNTIKEYEMREMQSSSSGSSSQRGLAPTKFPLRSFGSKNALNISTESYDDLHSIVDYCWRLLSEQIDSLQRCLPKEKSLHSEDEIFVALAQLKKVRDVLKGSLKLEDELEPPPGGSKT